MATAERRTQRRFRPETFPDPVYYVWRKLTSVRVALLLIATTVAFVLTGVVIPQVPPQLAGQETAVAEFIAAQRGTFGPLTDLLAEFPWFYDTTGGVFNLFNQPYFYALMAVLALSIAVCTVSRFPPIWRMVRRPQVRVGDRYFESARHRFDFVTPADMGTLEAVLRRHHFAVCREERDGARYLFADRFQWAQLSTFAFHLALILLVLGAIITKVGAEEFQFWLAEGQSHPLFAPGGDRQQILILADDTVARFADDGRALDFRSAVRVTSGGREVAAGDVTVNGPLAAAGYRIHQAAYWEHGAALQVRDAQTGQLLYSESLFLGEQFFGPRVGLEDALSGALFAEEVLQLSTEVRDIPGSGYLVLSLDDDQGLAVALIPQADGAFRFHYSVQPRADDGVAPLDAAALRIGAAALIAPRIRVYDRASGEQLVDDIVPLADAGIAGLAGARLGFLPLADQHTLAVGFDESAGSRRFFYYNLQDDTQRGVLEAGGRAALGPLQIEYVGEADDWSQYGALAPGESQRIGRIRLRYGGVESVFSTIVPDLVGAEGEALILLERFGQARTAETFDVRKGEDVLLSVESTTATSAGSDAARPARLGIGLGGGHPRFDLNEGEAGVVGEYEYRFLGPREFTGLTVRRDPGASLFWIAIGLGIASLLVTFFVPRRQLWARITPGRTFLAGLAGHGIDLRSELVRYAREAGAPDVPPVDDGWDVE